jgi:hypothetical protein
MHARVVRFTGVTQETIDSVRAQVEESDGPPPGVKATAMKMLFDEGQGTSLFISFHENEDDMKGADQVFGAMDPGDTPGSRASVDMCEVVIEREAP